jgi:hypothetical protein
MATTDFDDDTTFAPAHVAALADQILCYGLHCYLRDIIEVLVDQQVPHPDILAAVKMAAFKNGQGIGGPAVEAAKTILQRLAAKDKDDDDVADFLGEESWKKE